MRAARARRRNGPDERGQGANRQAELERERALGRLDLAGEEGGFCVHFCLLCSSSFVNTQALKPGAYGFVCWQSI